METCLPHRPMIKRSGLWYGVTTITGWSPVMTEAQSSTLHLAPFALYLTLTFSVMQLCLRFTISDGRYWQNNMNNVKANKSAHKESVRDLRYIAHWSCWHLCITKIYMTCYCKVLNPWLAIFWNSFCRTDLKFCSCSDDTTVKVWDFARCQEEYSLFGNVPEIDGRFENAFIFTFWSRFMIH